MRHGKVILLASLALFASVAASARDLGQWGDSSKATREWYARQMQPDAPAASCCGEADAYWADTFTQDGDSYVAVITDDRADEPLHRPHLDIGTRIKVPNAKVKLGITDPNPTGHGVIFISSGGHVYCYLPPVQM